MLWLKDNMLFTFQAERQQTLWDTFSKPIKGGYVANVPVGVVQQANR